MLFKINTPIKKLSKKRKFVKLKPWITEKINAKKICIIVCSADLKKNKILLRVMQSLKSQKLLKNNLENVLKSILLQSFCDIEKNKLLEIRID